VDVAQTVNSEANTQGADGKKHCHATEYMLSVSDNQLNPATGSIFAEEAFVVLASERVLHAVVPGVLGITECDGVEECSLDSTEIHNSSHWIE
jgi:hypothetical protein